MKSRVNRPAVKSKQRGAATVECLVCLPIVIAISFATIDLSSAMFIKESLTVAAYEGARVGAKRGGTDADVTAKIREVLDGRGINYRPNSVRVSTPGFGAANTLEHVTVTVAVPCSSNLVLTGALFTGRNLEASVTLRKEFVNL